MNYQQSKRGKLAYDVDTDLLVCVIRSFTRPADEVFVNLDEKLTVNDLYHGCSSSDTVYGVVYLQEVEAEGIEESPAEVLEMERQKRYDYLWHSNLQVMTIPESQLCFRE